MLARERPALAGRQHERPVGVGRRRGLGGQRRQLVEQLGDGQVDAAVVGGQAAPRLVVVVVGDHDARRRRQDRLEQRLARLEPFAEPGPAHAVGVGLGAPVGGAPQARRPRRRRRAASARACGRGATGASGPSSGWAPSRPKKASANSARPDVGGGRRGEGVGDALAGSAPDASTSRAWISGSGSGPSGGVEQRPAQVEDVAGELEVEERRLPLLELGRGRQHVVGEPRRLGHGDVDDDERARATPSASRMRWRVGERVRGVAALDDHRPVAGGVVGEDLLGDHVARHEARR